MLNEGFFGIGYGQVLAACRRLFKVGQGSSQVIGEAIVLGTSDVTGPTVASKGSGAPVTNVPHFVIQLPYSSAAAGANVTGAAPLCLQVPDGTIFGGNVRGVGAIDLQTTRSAPTEVVSGSYSFVAGRYNNVSGGSSAAFGEAHIVSGPLCFAGGFGNTVSSGGGYGCAFGIRNTVSGAASMAIGNYNTVDADHSIAVGWYATSRGIASTMQHAGSRRAADGDRQFRRIPQSTVTSNTTATVLTSTGAAESTGNTWVVPANYSGILHGFVVARNTANNDSIGWEIKAMVSRDSTAASVMILGSASVVGVGTADASMSSCGIAVGANTTNGSITITATGLAATTIAWSGYLHCIENG